MAFCIVSQSWLSIVSQPLPVLPASSTFSTSILHSHVSHNLEEAQNLDHLLPGLSITWSKEILSYSTRCTDHSIHLLAGLGFSKHSLRMEPRFTSNSSSLYVSLSSMSCLRGWVHSEGTLWAGMSYIHLEWTPQCLDNLHRGPCVPISQNRTWNWRNGFM